MLKLTLPAWLTGLFASKPTATEHVIDLINMRGVVRERDFLADELSQAQADLRAVEAERDAAKEVARLLLVTSRQLFAIATASGTESNPPDAALTAAYRNHSEAARAAIDHHAFCETCRACKPCGDAFELGFAESRARWPIEDALKSGTSSESAGSEESPNA